MPRSVADPLATHQACVNGTLHVLLAAREAGVRRVVYAASSSAYGNSERLPKCETDPTFPLSPYAVAKLAGEQYCAAFSEVYGLETVRLRYFNVFGPRQSPDSPYAAVIPLVHRGDDERTRSRIHGDGEQSRDFTFVADVVQANLLAAEAPSVSGKVYNIACGRRTSLLELVGVPQHAAGHATSSRRTRSARPGDVRTARRHQPRVRGTGLSAGDGHRDGAAPLPGMVVATTGNAAARRTPPRGLGRQELDANVGQRVEQTAGEAGGQRMV